MIEVLKKEQHVIVNKGLYVHHGIYVGEDSIIHYEKSGIKRISLREFSEGRMIQVIRHGNELNRDEIVTRAYSKLGEDRYNLIFHNCEHFANWCCSETYLSMQVIMTVDVLLSKLIQI